jgi:hypothetical protein
LTVQFLNFSELCKHLCNTNKKQPLVWKIVFQTAAAGQKEKATKWPKRVVLSDDADIS